MGFYKIKRCPQKPFDKKKEANEEKNTESVKLQRMKRKEKNMNEKGKNVYKEKKNLT